MSICTDGLDSYSRKKDKIEKAFIESFENSFIEEDDYMSMDDKFTVNTPVGTRMKLDKDTDVLKLPAGVLIRTNNSTGSYDGGVAVHTIYLTNEQYFGTNVSLEKKAQEEYMLSMEEAKAIATANATSDTVEELEETIRKAAEAGKFYVTTTVSKYDVPGIKRALDEAGYTNYTIAGIDKSDKKIITIDWL